MAYLESAEAVEWRRLHTWGGFLWPVPGEKEMGTKHAVLQGIELLDEVDWLLGGQMHPLMVTAAVKRSAESVVTVARRHGRGELAAVFQPYASEERRRRDERRAS